MDVIIQSLGFRAGNELESFVREKVSALKSDEIVRANVVLYKGPASAPENDYCEIRLEVPGRDHFVKKHSQHFEVAVNECVEVLTQMINKTKNKIKESRKGEADVIQDVMLDSDESNDDVELEDVVK